MEHLQFTVAKKSVFVFLELADHVIQLCIVPNPFENFLAQGGHLRVELLQFPGKDLLLHLIHAILQSLEMMEVLGNQQLQKLIEKTTNPQLALCGFFP